MSKTTYKRVKGWVIIRQNNNEIVELLDTKNRPMFSIYPVNLQGRGKWDYYKFVPCTITYTLPTQPLKAKKK